MKRNITQTNIEDKIKKDPEQTLYIIKDFSEFGDYGYISGAIRKLVSKHILIQVARGIYAKPYFSIFLKEEISPSLENISKLIARKKHWTITSEGNTALNLLGIDTQVPVEYHYASSGENRKIEIKGEGRSLYFHHRPRKEIEGLSPLSALIIEGIRAVRNILRRELSDRDVNCIRRILKDEDAKAKLRKDALGCRGWIKREIKKVLE
jgi:hypothetical protein